MVKKRPKKPLADRRFRRQTGPFRIGKAKTGLGMFAEELIRKGDFIIEYQGPLVHNDDIDSVANKYLFELNSRWTIDGSDRRNTARYINHSCKPNAAPYDVKGLMKIYAEKTIRPGEEITYDYGKEYFDSILADIGCKCPACKAGEGRTARLRRKRKRKH